ncbi:MAG TPA: cysteine dioxygenase family protein [Chloroflexota bacterium]|jgi:predicted metal-dependent enzyme (double-stranded beta helix superfamily)
MTTTYDVAAFARDLDAIVAEADEDHRAVVERAKPLLGRLLADMRWLDARYAEPRGGSVQYLLHKHPADAYSIVSVVFNTGYATSVHDHGTWGLVGVWRGLEREERFARTDDGARAGYAALRPAGAVVNAPGGVTHLLPPDEEIHRITNQAPHPSCSIHVYGGDLDGKLRHQYDLATGAIKDFRTSIVVLD